jgi:hypothetical protein
MSFGLKGVSSVQKNFHTKYSIYFKAKFVYAGILEKK